MEPPWHWRAEPPDDGPRRRAETAVHRGRGRERTLKRDCPRRREVPTMMTPTLPASVQRMLDAAIDERAKREVEEKAAAEKSADDFWGRLNLCAEKDLRSLDLWEHASLKRPEQWRGGNLRNLNAHAVPVRLPGLSTIWFRYRAVHDEETSSVSWRRAETFKVQDGPMVYDLREAPDLKAALLMAWETGRKLAEL